MTHQRIDDELKNIYLNLENPSSFSSKRNLYAEAKTLGISKEEVDKFLQKYETYYVHRPARKNFKYRKMYGSSLYSHVQADIKDLNAFKEFNNNFRYFLLVIDCYSRKVFCEPIKQKTPENVLSAFKKIFQENKFYPYFLLTDEGKEFFNKKMQEFCKEKEITQVALRSNPAKAAMAERAIQTVTTRLARAMTYKNTNKWIEFLDKTVRNYNNTIHSSTGMKPKDFTYKTKITPVQNTMQSRTKFQNGDIVCITKARGVFDKAYLGRWGKELFKIVKIRKGSPAVFELEDLNNEPVKGHFYEPEIQKVCNEKNIYHIEKILGRKTVKGKKFVLVRWMNYGPEFDSWEPIENVSLI